MPGISRSSPAAIAFAVSAKANQSEITKPSKPHSPRNTSDSSQVLSAQYSPLRRLYEVMIPRAPPSFTASSNGRRWISRSVRSSITESASMRSSSDSLPAKCLTVQATPSDWAPRTNAAPMRPASSGSSE